MHVGAERDLTERKRVSKPRVGSSSAHDPVANRKSFRVDDVALLSVLVFDERDARRAIRIVLDVLHRCRHAVLVALEIDDAVLALVATADSAHGDVTVIVAAARLLERLDQRLLGSRTRDLREIRDRAKAGALGHRLELTNRHRVSPRRSRSCRPRGARRWPSSSRASSPCGSRAASASAAP